MKDDNAIELSNITWPLMTTLWICFGDLILRILARNVPFVAQLIRDPALLMVVPGLIMWGIYLTICRKYNIYDRIYARGFWIFLLIVMSATPAYTVFNMLIAVCTDISSYKVGLLTALMIVLLLILLLSKLILIWASVTLFPRIILRVNEVLKNDMKFPN